MDFMDYVALFFIFGIWMMLIEAVKFVIVVKMGKGAVNQLVKQSTDAALSGALRAVMKYRLEMGNRARAKKPYMQTANPCYVDDVDSENLKGAEDDEVSDMR
jgi:hypothetical protein